MRTQIAIAATALVAASGIAVATAATDSPPVPATIEQCAGLLPAGKVYTFEITGQVDATGPVPRLSGEMSISDGTEFDRSEETEAFGQCMARLIK